MRISVNQWNSQMQSKTFSWADQNNVCLFTQKLGLPLTTGCMMHCVALRPFQVKEKIARYLTSHKLDFHIGKFVYSVHMVKYLKNAGN